MANKFKLMSQGGAHLKHIRQTVLASAKPGTNLLDLESQALALIKEIGATSNFAVVDNYGYATCLMVNDEYVHSKPKNRLLKSGDLLTLDVGILWHGWHLDSADTLVVGKKGLSPFLKLGQKTLIQAINAAQVGNRVRDISHVIDQSIRAAGYFPVRGYTGHGIGKKLHQEPSIPCFSDVDPKTTPLLKENQALAIEVMYATGTSQVKVDSDGWTARTVDGSLSAQFEHTVYLTKSGPVVLT